MNNFLDTNSFEHFLNFISLGNTELYQITEPSGFDAANFVVKQNDSRYSRDIIYGNDTINLSFYDANVELSSIEQMQDTDGRTSFYLDYGLKWILETYNRFGFEGKIEYILKKEGVLFTTGLLDMANPDTDGNTFFACSVIQSNQVANYKKHEETIIDLFSTKNAKNETITPAETFKFLRKSVPILKTSTLNCPNVFDAALSSTGSGSNSHNYFYCNNAATKTVEEINNTLAFPNQVVQNGDGNDSIAENFAIIQARSILTDIKIDIKDLIVNQRTHVADGGNGYADNKFIVRWGTDINVPMGEQILFAFYQEEGHTYQNPIHDYTVNIPYLPIDAKIWVYLWVKTRQSAVIGIFRAYTQISQYNLNVTANTFALNTVVKGVRYIDMMKQCSKFINNLPIVAPRFDVGGEFYDQVCYNRALISQDLTRPFTTTFNNVMGSTQEVNGDFEIMHDKIFQGQYPDFYENTEIGVFQIKPSEGFKENWNDKYKINVFSFGYKTYEQNRLTANTTGDVHTESEWIVPNLMVENKKEVGIDLIRSAFSQQVAVDLEIKTPQTSDENDDKVYIVDIVPLPEGTFNEFSSELQMQLSDGKLTILNKKSSATIEESVINWNVLGFNVGDNFQIVSGSNAGNYTVISITQTMLVLSPVGFVPTFTGDAYITMKFYYTDVLWQTRADEDFIVSGNTNSKNYPNLKYTIRRNMKHWESYLRTACSFNLLKSIRNSYFKNDPALETIFQSGINYIEKADIPVSSLQTPLVTPKTFDIVVVASFNQVITLLETLKIIRGFIRSYNIEGNIIKGFIKDLDYTWSTAELKLTLEEKYESETIILTYSGGILTVNDAIYTLSGASEWWKITGEYFTAFDINNVPLCNRHRFDKVSLNGMIYGSEYELLEALENL